MATTTKTTSRAKPASPSAPKAPAKAGSRAKAPVKAATKAVAKAPEMADIAPVGALVGSPVGAPVGAPVAAPVAAAPVPDRARRGDLLDALADRSTLKRSDLKQAMELVLGEIGKLMDAGDEVVLPPLGKLTVKKRVAKDGGDVLTVKIKRMTAPAADRKAGG